MMQPGQLKRGDHVVHDSRSDVYGIVIEVFERRGDRGTPVEYAKIRLPGREVRHAEHPTFVLHKS